ncbi:putative oxidoreductase,short chain dehydrogenase [Stipitochalara longipes BDJ]|nr:putative oxidoreductase,short chain dehydrogenase [Stipitochalara longipes BDJ]
MPNSLLPREGLTLEALFAPFRLTLLQPLFIGPILFAAYWVPTSVLSTSKWTLLKSFKPLLQSTNVRNSLVALLSIGLLRKINKTLSRLVLNNFTRDKTWDWEKEVVLITGGSAGIGALMARMFGERGIKVVILDIVAPSGNPSLLPNIHFYQVDITSDSRIREVADEIRKAHGDPTVLINNAGIGTNLPILTETVTQIRHVFEVNTISHFLLVKEFVPDMVRRNHGHIVTVASMASFLVHAQNVDYACSKASALAFHEGLGQELKARYGAERVRTTVVHPTWVRTQLIESLLSQRKITDFVLEPETVAEAVVQQVLSGYGAQLILPARLGPVSGVRGFPSWLQEGIRNGVNRVLES